MIFDKLFASHATPDSPRSLSSFLFGINAHRPAIATGQPFTDEVALTYSAVFCAVKVISETIAMLPWRVYREDGDRRELLAGSRLDVLLNRRPNDDVTAFTYREYLLACALLRGNGYAEIVRNGPGEAVALYPLSPDSVHPKRDDSGRVYYEHHNDDGTTTPLAARDVFHLRGPTKDGLSGWAIIALARESWALGLAGEQFASGFFGNGGIPGTVIQQTDNTIDMDQDAARNLLESFDRRHKGPTKAGKTALLEAGFEIKTIGIPQKDAQFIESRKFQVSEVARWFRLPPHKIGDMEAATFSNIEQQSIDFVTDAILPWVTRLEQEANFKLINDPAEITKINVNGLLRGDSAARSEFYNKMWQLGAMSTNDIRRLEDMNPIGPAGDQHFVMLNMQTLEQAAVGESGDTSAEARAVLLDAHQRNYSKELRAAERAYEKDHGGMDTFYAKHLPQMVDMLLPATRVIASQLGVDMTLVPGLVHAHCRESCERSLIDYANGNWHDWEQRAATSTDALIERLCNAK